MEIMQSFYSCDMVEFIMFIWCLFDGIFVEEFRLMNEDVEEVVISVLMIFEMMGLLFYKEIVLEDFVIDFVGGLVFVIWCKFEKWEEMVRVE